MSDLEQENKALLEERKALLANLDSTHACCTRLLNESRQYKQNLSVWKDVAINALQEIALCNDGKGYMPETAQRALGHLHARGLL